MKTKDPRFKNIPHTTSATITTYDLSSISLAARTIGDTPTGREMQALYDRLVADHPEIVV